MKKKKQPEPSKKTAAADEQELMPEVLEMQQLAQNLQEAAGMRDVLQTKYEATPTEEIKDLLAQIDEAIETGRYRLSRMSAVFYRKMIDQVSRELTETIAQTDDEQFLSEGDQSAPARHLRDYMKVRDDFSNTLHSIHPDDKPEELLASFNKVITDAQRQIREKRQNAEKLFPHLKKEYEMDANYKKALADLVEAIETRDQLAEALKQAAPEERPEGLRLLSQLDKQIEKGENALAVEFEAAQNMHRKLDDLREQIYAYSREERRHLLQHLRENSVEDMDWVRKILEEEFGEG